MKQASLGCPILILGLLLICMEYFLGACNILILLKLQLDKRREMF